MITYSEHNTHISVRIDGTRVGEIRRIDGGFRYKPTGGKPGETFATIAEVKRSLEWSGFGEATKPADGSEDGGDWMNGDV